MTAGCNWGGMCGMALLLLAIILILVADHYEKQIVAFFHRILDRFYNKLHPHDDDNYDTY